jgi:plastocyanin
MPINFPNSPAPNEVYTVDQKSWRYTGTAWNVISSGYDLSTSPSFTNLAVAGQSTVVADTATDTLTLVAGSGIAITTNASTDTVTLTSVASTGNITITDTTLSVTNANPITITPNLVLGGTLRFPDNTVQTTATVQGPAGPAGPTGAGGTGSGNVNSVLGSYVDNAIVRYSGASGTTIKNSSASISDAGLLSATNLTVTGTVTAAGEVSYVRAYFDTLAALQAISATTWHGMVAHVHENGGRMYFAHAGAWQPMSNFSDLNIFKTIAVAGQSSVVADSDSDTLTLIAGTNITITTNATTDTITINATGGGSGGTLNDLSDVVISAPSTNQVLKYDGSNWVNGTDATGGGTASDSFTTIAVAGQTSVVADSSTDTLTLVAGTGISLATNAGTDTVTITSTVSGGATAFTGLSDRSDLTVDQFYLPAITRLDVTFNGSTAYRFDQYGTTDDPTIYAINGTTIAFILGGVCVSHPFLIQTNAGANYDTGLVHVSTAGVVSTGSSAQGKTSGTLYWKIPDSISGNYRYQCSNHIGMIGTIVIKNFASI